MMTRTITPPHTPRTRDASSERMRVSFMASFFSASTDALSYTLSASTDL